MEYRESICEMVNKITTKKALKRIYKFVMYLRARDGETNASDGKELQSCG